MSTAEMLTGLGHTVTEAANGTEALASLDGHAFDVLVTDLALPDLSGEAVAAHAIDRQPAIRVVFATGYAAGPDSPVSFGAAVLLEKPYSEQAIAAALFGARER